MQVTWLTSEAFLPFPISGQHDEIVSMQYADFSAETLRRSIVLVLGAAGTDAIEAAAVMARVRDAVPVWIYDPHPTMSSSAQWGEAGAAHVATTVEDVAKCIASLRTTPIAGYPSRTSLLGHSSAVRSVASDIEMIASRRCNVLVEGETGTGKEVVARDIHSSGNRTKGPLVAVNCGAIPEALLEAELFGHTRGAFTGAVQARAGRFELANHGTLFLDEIGDMPLAIQAKLLRVLQEREVERLGGSERIKLDVRVIAATNVNLAERVRQGLFRQDLYYRLNVFRIEMPPLRQRSEDIPLLAQHFIDRFCSVERLPRKILDSRALDCLLEHHWPGNVRELENTMESAVIVSGSRTTILVSDLRMQQTRIAPPKSVAGSAGIEIPAHGLDYQSALEDFEKSLLAQALNRARGNKTAAAELLGLKRTTLAAKMRALESRLPRLVA